MANVRISNEGRIEPVTMDRPPVNAMSTEMYVELRDAFSAGADIKELNALAGSGDYARDEYRQALAPGDGDEASGPPSDPLRSVRLSSPYPFARILRC